MAMATAANSPPQSSAEDIFSDTMELASYLHRRVQEIGKQFCHRPFRINTNEKGESLPGFLQGLSTASALPLGPSKPDFQKACDPAQPGALRKITENCLQGEERAPSLAEEKHSSEPCCSRAFLPNLSGCAEIKECMTANLYDNFFDKETKGCMRIHLHDSRPDGSRTCNRVHLFQQKGEDACVLPLPDREQKFPFYSEKPSGFVCCAPPFPKVEIAHVLPSAHRGKEFPLFSENATNSVCCAPRLPSSKREGMCDVSPKSAPDVDAANCPAALTTEERGSSISPIPCSPCSAFSPNSSNHAPRPLCHSLSVLNSSENLSLTVWLPSLQDHATSDAENARVLPCIQKGERDRGNSEHSAPCVVVSQNPCQDSLLERCQGNTVLQESAGKQVGIDTQSTHSRAVSESPPSPAGAESPSLPHSHVLRSVSSVDSSECDNCGSDAVKGYVVTDRAGSRNSDGVGGNKSEEIDAMSEAECLGTHRKDDNNDDNGTIVVAVRGDTLPKQEIKNDALDLLLDAIQVTSGGVLVEKEDADASRPSSLHTTKHALRRKGNKSFHERIGSSSGKVLQTTKEVPAVNGQSCLPEGVNGSIRLGATSSRDIQDDTHKGNSPDFLSSIGPLPVGRFPVVRKRSYRCSKTVVREEASGNSLPTAIRFKSLQAVSEVNYSKKGKTSKEPAANKQEQGTKVMSLKMQEREKTIYSLHSGLNGKREKDWEERQEIAENEDQFSKPEKRARLADADDFVEGRGKGGKVQPIPASAEGEEVKDEEEQAVMSRRARSQVLPNKFSDSVLQPWRKRERRKG